MALNSNISWCDHTWNPWQGCRKVSGGCLNCYMFREKKRYGQNPNKVVRSADRTFNAPLRWDKKNKGRPMQLVFVCSWSDFFIEEADEWRDEAMEIMTECQNLIFMILTKRSSLIEKRDYPRNVWIGVSVESNVYLKRLLDLKDVDVLVKFMSYEPALGHLDKFEDEEWYNCVDWVISGGESCSDRKADVRWFRDVRNVCLKNNIAYFHKQNGGYKKMNGVYGGCKIDDMEFKDYPKLF